MTPIKIADLPFAGSSTRFEGGGHGSSISFFLSRFAPGGGPLLHRHPYDETFIIEAGTALFTAGDAKPGRANWFRSRSTRPPRWSNKTWNNPAFGGFNLE